MGSAYGSPNFKDLVEAVSYMIMHCYTPTFSPDSEKKPPQPTKEGYHICYSLDDNVINDLILHPEFLKIAAKNASDYIGYCFAHLSFNNFLVSKAVAEQLLKQINETDCNKIEACMGFAKPFLSINDDLKLIRAEWILGYSGLNTSNALPFKLNRFGICYATYINQDIYTYQTPLNEKRTYNVSQALLQLLWRFVGKMDNYIVFALSSLL